MSGQEQESERAREVKAAWDEVGARFAELGSVLKGRLQGATADDARSQDASEAGAGGQDTTSQRSGSDDAGPARQVMDAVDDAFTALGDAVRDSDFQRQAQGSLNALGAALGLTFTELGELLRERFEKPGR